MAQIQCQTITIPLEHATPEQFYSVFNPPYLIHDICRKIGIGIDIQIAPDYRATIQLQSPNGEIRKIEGEVTMIEPRVRTTTFRTWIQLGSDHKLKLEVPADGTVKWTVSCNHCPPPDDYIKLLESVSQAVDNHFAKNEPA